MKKVNIKKLLVFILSVIFLMLLMTGCGNETAESTPSESTSSEVILNPTPSEEPIDVKPDDVYLDGTVYGGVDISGMTYKEALKAIEDSVKDYENKLKSFKVTVTAGEEEDEKVSCEIKGTSITFTDKSNVKLAELIVNDIKGTHDFYFSYDKTAIQSILNESFKDFDIEPKDAVITGVEDGVIIYEKAVMGKKINVQKTITLIEESLLKLNSDEIIPEYDDIEPALTDELVEKFTCIGYCATTINTSQYESIYNMKLAMKILDNRVVLPGETLSFMKYMDMADSYGGFLSGNIIMNGILVPASGGGICQASTTIYGVALDSGMTIIERDNHGIPSSYVKLGLDAMVSAGSSDFIFRNDHETPILLDTSYGDRTLYARIYGIQPEEWDEIGCDAWITKTEPETEGVRFIIDPELEEGEFRLENSAAKGYRTAAQRYYYKDGVLVRVENLTNSYYPPRQKTYTIGKGTDTTTLEDGTEKRDEGKIEPTPSPSPEASPSPETSPTPETTPSVSPEATPTPENTTTPAPTPTPEEIITPTGTPGITDHPSDTPIEGDIIVG